MIGLVLTPTLGRSPWLQQTVESVREGAGSHQLRHLFVAPPDRCSSVQAQIDGKCRILASPADGVYGALNAGLEAMASEKWDAFTWLNDDDAWAPGAALRALDHLTAQPACDVVYGETHYINARDEDWGRLPTCRLPADLPVLWRERLPALSQHGTWVRRDTVGQLGGFDLRLRLAADFDWWARCLAGGKRFDYDRGIVGLYRLHGSQLSQGMAGTAQEIETSAQRHWGPRRRWASLGARVRFRRTAMADLVERWRKTGCVRSAALYRLAAISVDAASTEGGGA